MTLNETVARIRAARNARNAYREDPVLNDDDRAYRAGTLLSTREFPGWEAPPRKGRALPPNPNRGDIEMLRAIFGEGGKKMTLSESVAAIVKVYARNPMAIVKDQSVIVKALTALVESEIEKRDRRDTAALARATCRKLHEELSERVTCEGCFEAALEKINGK